MNTINTRKAEQERFDNFFFGSCQEFIKAARMIDLYADEVANGDGKHRVYEYSTALSQLLFNVRSILYLREGRIPKINAHANIGSMTEQANKLLSLMLEGIRKGAYDWVSRLTGWLFDKGIPFNEHRDDNDNVDGLYFNIGKIAVNARVYRTTDDGATDVDGRIILARIRVSFNRDGSARYGRLFFLDPVDLMTWLNETHNMRNDLLVSEIESRERTQAELGINKIDV